METKSTSFVSRTRRWLSQQSINKEFLQSFTGTLKISEMVSLATGFGALLHYVKLIAEASIIDVLYIVIMGVATFSTLIFIFTLVFNLQQKVTTSTKSWNMFMFIYPLIIAVLVLISSSLLVYEAVQLGDSHHSQPSNPAKCSKCGKINVAAVFGFLSWILLTLDLFLQMRHHGFCLRKRKGRMVTVQPIVSPEIQNEQEQATQSHNDRELSP